MKVKVIKDLCIGCGTCTALCPKAFKFEDGGKAVAYSQDETDENKQMAIDSCPTQAIEGSIA